MNDDSNESSFTPSPELYFLIYKLLSNGPLQDTFKVLTEELEKFKILPKRIDWEGNEHDRKVEDMEQQFPNIRPDYLQQLCNQMSRLTGKTVNGKLSSLLSLNYDKIFSEKREYESNFQQLSNYITRYRGIPKRKKYALNIVNTIRGRELSEPLPRSLTITPKIYSSLQIQRQTLGHLSAVYCLLFDYSGKYIITGADDLLIKLWSARTGRLISSFRGASSEITDIAINPENTLLAAGSIDRILRVWNLQTGVPVAVLTGHNGMITSVNFCTTMCWGLNYLISTSTDGSVAFWAYTTDFSTSEVEFRPNPTLYHERMRPGQAQMICSSVSPGGTFVATGSADHHVRVYYMKGDEGPQRILETEAHTDRVDSIQWAHSGLKFMSGSKDGTAIIWHFETQQWKSNCLNMTAKLPNSKTPNEEPKKLKVTMVCWDYSDSWVITAVSDYTLKVWHASTGSLDKVLIGHTDEVYVLESHPHDRNIILSAGHDGQLFIWDLVKGEMIAKFLNSLEGQGYGAIFDGRWSPDGYTLAASDSHGHILIFGFGTGNKSFEQLPKELFFHTDYRPLVCDANHYVLDEQTQLPPHLMPPPFLVDIDGNPYPPILQRLVPGRENCKTEQLVPNIVLGNEGNQEIIQGPDEVSIHNQVEDPRNHILFRSANRMNGEGLRQSSGDWQRDPNIKWIKPTLIQPMKPSVLKRAVETLEAIEKMEKEQYHRELCRRPHMINSTSVKEDVTKNKNNEKKKRQGPYRTRRTGAQNNAEEQRESQLSEVSDSTPNDDDDDHEVDDSDFSESSGYSDWVAEEGVILEPPKRSKRRQVSQNVVSYASDEELDHHIDKISTQKSVTVERRTVQKVNQQDALKYKLNDGEVPEIYKPSDWLAETKPKKTPYFPQMGDELVYYMQGHQLYVGAVKTKQIYDINIKDLPWVKLQLRDHEYVKVLGIRYEIKPPRLCCLKLALLDDGGRLTGKVFSVKYHDMPDVLDFFILKQLYDTAMARQWNTGDKFRCIIDDAWWIGEIVSQSSASDAFPDSAFMCYEVKWANGESERMSPWDLEPLDDARAIENEGEAIPVLKEELDQILYNSVPEDWPNTDRETASANILLGLCKIMELAIAEPFIVPVDLSTYPTYAFLIEYPVDFSTIKARFENRFYRRVTSAQFDVRYIATNAEKFNERHSIIVRRARILTELSLRVIKQCSGVVDVPTIYHQLVNAYDSTDTELDVPSTSRTLRVLPSRSFNDASEWKNEAKALLDAIWKCEDSVPFQTPVNISKYPDYLQMIEIPMDLSTVRDNLLKDKYRTPYNFCKDMRLIFQNSRLFNTNKRSRIYVMTVRLSAIFEEHIKKIIFSWKKAKRKSMKQRGRSQNITSNSNDTSSVSSISKDSNTDVEVVLNDVNHNKNGKLESDVSDNDEDNTPLNELIRNTDSDTLTTKNLECLELDDYNSIDGVCKISKGKVKRITDDSDQETSTSNNTQTNTTEGEQIIIKVRKDNETESSDSDSSEKLNNIRRKKQDSDTEDSYKPPSRANASTSDEEVVFTSTRPSRKYNKSSKSSDSEDSYKPSRQSSKKRIPVSKFAPKYSSRRESTTEDDSDDEPLSLSLSMSLNNFRNTRTAGKVNCGASTSARGVTNNSVKRKRTRMKIVADSDSDTGVSSKRYKDESDTETYVTSVSSRGRIRKLTPRVLALMKK